MPHEQVPRREGWRHGRQPSEHPGWPSLPQGHRALSAQCTMAVPKTCEHVVTVRARSACAQQEAAHIWRLDFLDGQDAELGAPEQVVKQQHG